MKVWELMSMTEMPGALDCPAYAGGNILQRGTASAGWDVGSLGRPGAAEGVLEPYVAGLPGQDADRYPAEGIQSWI